MFLRPYFELSNISLNLKLPQINKSILMILVVWPELLEKLPGQTNYPTKFWMKHKAVQSELKTHFLQISLQSGDRPRQKAEATHGVQPSCSSRAKGTQCILYYILWKTVFFGSKRFKFCEKISTKCLICNISQKGSKACTYNIWRIFFFFLI